MKIFSLIKIKRLLKQKLTEIPEAISYYQEENNVINDKKEGFNGKESRTTISNNDIPKYAIDQLRIKELSFLPEDVDPLHKEVKKYTKNYIF